MNQALVFSENSEWYRKVVTAQQVASGEVSRNLEFVDVDYQFRVTFVRHSIDDREEHFRLYYSLEDYEKMTPERKSEYDYVRSLQHVTESQWHKHWEEQFSFGKKEKVFINHVTKKSKRADIYLDNIKTCVEFQHSFIACDFKSRNDFYDEYGNNVIWLYDLTDQTVTPSQSGYNSFEVLEYNSKGFFRISEYPENLLNYPVLIQDNKGLIFLVNELHRITDSTPNKATIRVFSPLAIYTEDTFIEAVKQGSILLQSKAFLSNKGQYSEYEKIVNDINQKQKDYIAEQERLRLQAIEECNARRQAEQERLEKEKKDEERKKQAYRRRQEELFGEPSTIPQPVSVVHTNPDSLKPRYKDVFRQPKLEDKKLNQEVIDNSPSGHYGLEQWEWDKLLKKVNNPNCEEIRDFPRHGCRRYYYCLVCNQLGLEDEFDARLKDIKGNKKWGVHKGECALKY